jgi:catechol 2,3-dioxygenase-like lactoylglutathione lyase family enzyme
MATFPPARDDVHAAHFYVRSLDASVKFYVDTLGFQVIRRGDDHALVALGGSIVRLTDANRRDRGSSRGTVTAWAGALVVPDVDDVYRRVRDARVVVIDEMRDRASRVKDFVTVDPDGFPIRLSTAV